LRSALLGPSGARCVDMPDADEIPPRETVYVNNLNDRINKEELKKSLYACFTQFGPILDVIAHKNLKMKGQAFIVFRDISAATQAVRQMQGFPFYEKPMQITYAKTKSDAAAKFDGTYEEKQKEERAAKRKAEREAKASAAAKRQATGGASAAAAAATDGAPSAGVGDGPSAAVGADAVGAGSSSGGASSAGAPPPLAAAQPTVALPNAILFVENLPEAVNEMMLSMLFQQFPGYKEVRLVPGKQGIAFVEFEGEAQSGVAMSGLQGFKITPQNLMKISYAKR